MQGNAVKYVLSTQLEVKCLSVLTGWNTVSHETLLLSLAGCFEWISKGRETALVLAWTGNEFSTE